MKDYQEFELPCLVEKKGRIVEVNNTFLSLTGFMKEDLIAIAFLAAWKNLLRINVSPHAINNEKETFLFTKSFKVRVVKIKKQLHSNSNTHIYTFLEKPFSRLEKKLPFVHQLYSESKTGVAIYSVPNLILLMANQKYLNFFDKPFNKASCSIGKDIYTVASGFTGSMVESNWMNVLKTGELFEMKDMPYKGYDRGITYWNTIVVPIYEEGIIKYIVNTADETTEFVLNKNRIKEQTKIIKEQNKKLETIMDNISDSLTVIDNDGECIISNNAFKDIMNIRTDIGKCVKYAGETIKNEQIYFDEYYKKLFPQDSPSFKVIKGEKVENQRVVVKNDFNETHYDCNAIPVYDEKGEFQFGVITYHDVTELIQKDKEIIKQQEYLKVITDNMSDALFIINLDGSYAYLNQRAYDFAYQGKKINEHGESLKHTKYFDESGIELKKDELPGSRILRGEVIDNTILKAVRPDKTMYMSFNGRPVYNSNGEIDYAILCIRNMTDLINSKQALLESEKKLLKMEKERNEVLRESIELKDEFLYLITHEFRTPMAVVNSALQAIELIYKDEVTANIAKYLKTIKQNTNRQLRLVNNLLDITRINSGNIKLNMKTFDIVFITKAIINSVEVYARQKGVKITFNSSSTNIETFIDEEKYERIMLNLLSNALKFTPKGKNIHISIFIKQQNGKKMVCISVRDEGIGIPKDRQSILFQRFGQADTSLSRQAEGTGIGLHLVKLLINAFDGEIILDSEVGKGAIFTVMIPLIKVEELDGIGVSSESNNEFVQNDNRLIQAIDIEFSDIYL